MPPARAIPTADAAAVPAAPAESRTLAPTPERLGSPSSAIRLRVARAPDGAEVAALTVEEHDPSTQPEAIRRAEQRLLDAIKSRDTAHALTLASVLVYLDPDNTIAQRIKNRCATQMDGVRTLAFPRPGAIPRQRVPWSDLTRRTLSREEAYLLWCVDGRLTVEEIVDASAMAPLTAFETLDSLMREGIVDLG